MMRRLLGCMVVLAACCSAGLAAPAKKTRVAEFQGIKVRKVWLQVAYHISVRPVDETGKRGKRMVLVVPNESPRVKKPTPKKETAASLKGLKKGDLIQITYDVRKGVKRLQEVKAYKLKPGEKDPMGYVFVGLMQKNQGGESFLVVAVRKYGYKRQLRIPNVKEDGLIVPAPYTAIRAERMEPGDVVDIVTSGKGRRRVLTGISKFAPPFQAEFVKLTVNAARKSNSARIELKVGDEVREFDLETVVRSGQRRVPAKLLLAAKNLKPGMKVRVKARGPRKTRAVARIERIKEKAPKKGGRPRKPKK